MWQDFEQLSQRLRIPDLWQQVALEQLRQGFDVVIDAPTGAGKTFVFEMLVERGKLNGQAVYTVPTRALANDKLMEWRRRGWRVGIATGDLTDQTDAPVLVATLETQLERILRRDPPRLLVIDEYQLIGHRARGSHYEQTIALAPAETQMLLLSGSSSNADEVVAWLERLGRHAVLVQSLERPVPLEETPIEALVERPPRGVEGFWPRLVSVALMADLAPILVFAPRRREAERIARQLASALPPGTSLSLTRQQQSVAGKDLTKILQQRIAWHHSGLSYRVRAGLIEPLAKAGHLRVIVATTGLAAGVNFSVRSVLVASTTYPDGPYLRQLEPDELLQMFGRAGRRGLDTVGHVLVTSQSPRLSDARQRPVRRPAEAGWPVLLRLMYEAARRGEPPLAAALQLTSRLFSTEPPALGLERAGGNLSVEKVTGEAVQDALSMLSMGPSRAEFLKSKSEWEPLQTHQRTITTLGNAWLHRSGGWRPALADPAFVESVEPLGRTWLMPDSGLPDSVSRDKRPRRYGRELTAALRSDGTLRPTRPFSRLLGITRRSENEEPDLMRRWLHLLEQRHPDQLHEWSLAWRGDALMLRCDLSQRVVGAVRDRFGCCLIAPPVRLGTVESETSLRNPDSGLLIDPLPDSPLHAWRKLDLIDQDAVPARRGSVFCLFQHGEGLAIAAALEEPDYPVESIAQHIANLRGPRLTLEPEPGDSERLAAACHRGYGTRTHAGYLLHGLPEHYSEGAEEILAERLQIGKPLRRVGRADVAAGDLDRAFVEWLSLLRRIDAAPELDWSRWNEFKQAAREALRRYPRSSDLDQLPPLSAT